LFIPCGRLSWLPVSFLLHVKHTLSYRIVSFTPGCMKTTPVIQRLETPTETDTQEHVYQKPETSMS